MKDKHIVYEKIKDIIAEFALSPKQYEWAIKELAEILDI